MPQIGPLEILAVAVLALVVFGPQRLPEIARNIGKAINELRRVTSEMKSEFGDGLTITDTDADADSDSDEPEVPEPSKAAPADEPDR